MKQFVDWWAVLLTAACGAYAQGLIDREAVVRRHCPRVNSLDPSSFFTLGNGHFAFTSDVTGLQTLNETYYVRCPLYTQSDWGWHTIPVSHCPGVYPQQYQYTPVTVDGKTSPYPLMQRNNSKELLLWLRANPHRLDLGRVFLVGPDGMGIDARSVEDIDQHLDLWTGVMTSRFSLSAAGDGAVPVTVTTAVHPLRDALAVQVDSPLLSQGALRVRLSFPYGSMDWTFAADWTAPENHTTELNTSTPSPGVMRGDFSRFLDAEKYYVGVDVEDDGSNPSATIRAVKSTPHLYEISGPQGEPFSASSLGGVNGLSVREVLEDSAEHWSEFWHSGAAIDFGGTEEPRAVEIERRTVLSQYLMAVQERGLRPPADTGLTVCHASPPVFHLGNAQTNSWYGKFHLEMRIFHSLHWPLWNRGSTLLSSNRIYEEVREEGLKYTKMQGYDGVRWPKMIGPPGTNPLYTGPSAIGPLLIWQNPHTLLFAEADYRSSAVVNKSMVLRRWNRTVHDTAEFMVSYAMRAKPFSPSCLNLGPPILCGDLEAADPGNEMNYSNTLNPTFELTARPFRHTWRERQGMARVKEWDEVFSSLCDAPVHEGVYYIEQNSEGSGLHIFDMVMYDVMAAFLEPRGHNSAPGVLIPASFMPGFSFGLSRDVMRPTLERILSFQEFDNLWPHHFPTLALVAARLGDPSLAVECLLMNATANAVGINGHYPPPNPAHPNKLPFYLPANGNFLTAVAIMAEGWDGSHGSTPGFPASWHVRHEGFVRWM